MKRNDREHFYKTISLAGLCMFGLAATVEAEKKSDVRQVTVSYADLNLNSSTGKKVLNRRLERAAAKVCLKGWRGSRLTLDEHRRSLVCYKKSLAEAKKSISL
ncbi:MAG: UrcA family protein [Cellvibrionaceae bacterium]|nr:UrcA family protein [Cellvibrionaceae bacterium]